MTNHNCRWLALTCAVALFACSSSERPDPRFANAPAVTVVNDRQDVPRPPPHDRYLPVLFHYDGNFHRRVARGLALTRQRRAHGVNALDEVPDSTWFTNRIGVRALTPEQIRTGPVTLDNPELHTPWTIVSTKRGGDSPGFIIEDARGVRYLIKFDAREFPELETTAHVIVNRLLWAAGYNVPEDQISFVRDTDLQLGEHAVKWDKLNGDKPLTLADVRDTLAKVYRTPAGKIRTVSSRMLTGEVLGGHPVEGTRKGDPNDRIPHQLRRDLRGATVLFSWFDHGDLNGGNSLDVWVADRADPHRHYVVHYLIDFGRALGVMAPLQHDLHRGFDYIFDLPNMADQLATLGMSTPAWEYRDGPGLHGVGLFEAKSFDPGAWRPDTPSWTPWLTADRFDKYWGAKLVARFTPEQLRAAVASARLSDPRAAAYLAHTLWVRARAVARYWFSQVSPLDHFAVEGTPWGNRLCFDDLLITNRLAAVAEQTRYTITRLDFQGRRLGDPDHAVPVSSGHTCTAPMRLTHEGYAIVKLTTERPGFARSTYVHVAPDPATDKPRVIGIWRD